MSKYAPGEDDLYMRTLELGQVQESDFYKMCIRDSVQFLDGGIAPDFLDKSADFAFLRIGTRCV